ncbi:hypothetical protein C0416_00875 [bacterium]|nr:hypothetical protein [bacterium]
MSNKVKMVTRIAGPLSTKYLKLLEKALFSKESYSEQAELWEVCRGTARALRPEKLGIIAYQDNKESLSLYDVHSCTWLSKYDCGKELIITIAATAILAEMYRLAKIQIIG